MLVPTFIKPDARNRLSFKAKVEQYGIVSLVKIGPIEFFFYLTVAEAEEMGRKNKEVCVSSRISSKCNPTETDIFLAKQNKNSFNWALVPDISVHTVLSGLESNCKLSHLSTRIVSQTAGHSGQYRALGHIACWLSLQPKIYLAVILSQPVLPNHQGHLTYSFILYPDSAVDIVIGCIPRCNWLLSNIWRAMETM